MNTATNSSLENIGVTNKQMDNCKTSADNKLDNLQSGQALLKAKWQSDFDAAQSKVEVHD